jgi:hypothetical protein
MYELFVYLCGVMLGEGPREPRTHLKFVRPNCACDVRNLVYLLVMLVVSHFIVLYIMSYASRFLYHTHALVYTI